MALFGLLDKFVLSSAAFGVVVLIFVEGLVVTTTGFDGTTAILFVSAAFTAFLFSGLVTATTGFVGITVILLEPSTLTAFLFSVFVVTTTGFDFFTSSIFDFTV